MNEIHNRYVASVAAPIMLADPIGGHRYQGWTPCINWCLSQFGDDGWWFVGDGVFEFVDEADHLMFMLRWA